MRNLYFMFALIALPIATFAETNETSAGSVHHHAKQKACAKKDKSEKCIEKARTHFENTKMNEGRDHVLINRVQRFSA
jgi:hypothetical protein